MMKKNLFIAATAVLALASCQSDENLAANGAAESNETPVSFSAYSTSALSTRGTVATTDGFQADGIGVFAFYQPAVNGAAGANYTSIKYPTPNFMYNQKVVLNDEKTEWTYTPIKYWPNNENDKVSFFAYAPFVGGTTWEDLGINTDATGKTITKTFDIYNSVKDQKDYLFAEPSLNQLKPTGDNVISQNGVGKADASSTKGDVVKFNFSHVTSKVNLYVGVNVDQNTASAGSTTAANAASVWTDSKTEIEIKSIEFKDLATTLTWTSSATDKWTAEGEQDIKVVPSENDHANKIDATNWNTAAWHRVLAGSAEGTKDTDEYMFLAPQELSNQEIVLTYVVKTTDKKLYKGKSEITNVITMTWDDFKNSVFTKFEAGKQYRLYFLIGMQSVKVAATVNDWEDATNAESVLDAEYAKYYTIATGGDDNGSGTGEAKKNNF